MRFYKWGFILVLALMSAIARVGAQDTTKSHADTIPEDVFVVQEYGTTFEDLTFSFNICPRALYEVNWDRLPEDSWARHLPFEDVMTEIAFISLTDYLSAGFSIIIPAHKECYTRVETALLQYPSGYAYRPDGLVQMEKDYNVCVEEFAGLFTPRFDKKTTVFVPKDAPPCLNEQGQRLIYHEMPAHDRTVINPHPYRYVMMAHKTWVTEGYSTLPWIEGPEDFKSLGYCVNEIKAINPSLDLAQENLDELTFQYAIGTRFFIPENVRRCDFVPIDGESLYSLSQKYNVCMEDILDASNLSMYSKETMDRFLAIPLEGPPCYDKTGKRLNVPEETVYKPQVGESFLDVARKYDICLDALWDANPIMKHWDGTSYRMPDVIFIPMVKSCEFTMTLTIRPNMKLLGLAVLTNICRNRIEDANPHLWGGENNNGSSFNGKIAAGQTVTLPERPPCYRLTSQEHIEQIHYACYAVPVTPESDFTGHVPPVTASLEAALPYCYEITEGMTLIYDNAAYTLYRRYGADFVLSECTGIDLNILSKVNEDWPVPELSRYKDSMIVPQPHKDCDASAYLIGARKRMQERTYKAGYLIDGVYTVNFQDTLSSISRKYGYLPQWIAQLNGLSAPYTIYYLQELKMPPYPSLYTLTSTGGLIVLVSTAIYGVRWWSHRGYTVKKKNS